MPLQPDSVQALLHEKAVIPIPCPHIRLAITSGSLFPFSNFCPPSSSPSLSCHISDFLIHLLPQICNFLSFCEKSMFDNLCERRAAFY
ncbi:hypothetical protein Gotur_031380 [Gossypium turneri]